jgi:transposase
MRGRAKKQASMLAFIDPETLIPADHPLRTIKRFADAALLELSALFDEMYAADGQGRASIPPERLLKANLLISLYSVRSERAFCEELTYHLLYRWFLDMDLVEPSFDHSTFSKNRARLLRHRVSREFFDAVVRQADQLHLLSDEHFSVDSTLIEAAASLKSFRPKDEPPPSKRPDGGSPNNRWVDFHREKRSNATHQSLTDPDARLYRKGRGKEARLSYMGQALMENRHGLLVDFQVTTATGTAERDVVPHLIDEARQRGFHPRTLGADKAYDTREFVQGLRAQGVTPHVAQNTTGRRSAVDARTTRVPGYDASQKVRRRIEIVCSQLTKTRVRTGLGSWDDIPNLHRVIGYDHSVDQQLYQLAPLLESGLLEATGQLLQDVDG